MGWDSTLVVLCKSESMQFICILRGCWHHTTDYFNVLNASSLPQWPSLSRRGMPPPIHVVPTYIVQMRQARTCWVNSMGSSHRVVQFLHLNNIFTMAQNILAMTTFTTSMLCPSPIGPPRDKGSRKMPPDAFWPGLFMILAVVILVLVATVGSYFGYKMWLTAKGWEIWRQNEADMRNHE